MKSGAGAFFDGKNGARTFNPPVRKICGDVKSPARAAGGKKNRRLTCEEPVHNPAFLKRAPGAGRVEKSKPWNVECQLSRMFLMMSSTISR